ncbi:MAG TPA: ABC transporter permease [Actinomycetota bacterium]|nr:ABC transporter permease [Actinomycetota bacterium]
MESKGARIFVKAMTVFVLAFLYLPLAVVVVYAFNKSQGQSWPISGFTTHWFADAWHTAEIRTALRNSIVAGLGATAIAIVLGTMLSFAVARFRFFGRNTISFVFVLPLALPGIVTGIALNATINESGIPFSLLTIIIGHATFCVVVVFNNVVARLRRMQGNIVEASQDLGASGWQTFRLVTLPNIATALVAGGLLAFALSFDEIVVTNFTSGTDQTLPKWIFNQIRLPHARPLVNVVALFVIALSLIPVYFAQRLTSGTEGSVGARTAPIAMSSGPA